MTYLKSKVKRRPAKNPRHRLKGKLDIMNYKPVLSVVMPVFNKAPSLDRAALSVLEQSYANLELILINDGSTDTSSEKCDQIAALDRRVVVIHQANAGVSAARNRGIAAARGEYITFVDADDTVEESIWSWALGELLRVQGDIVFFGMRERYYWNDVLLEERMFSPGGARVLEQGEELGKHFFRLLETNTLASACNKIFRSSLVLQLADPFPSKMSILEDLCFTIKVMRISERILLIPAIGYNYRIDLRNAGLRRRSNNDYFLNFQILDKALRRFALSSGLVNSQMETSRLSGLIFRFYTIGLEKELLQASLSHFQQYALVKQYLTIPDVQLAAREGAVDGKLLLLRWMTVKRLFLVAWLTIRCRTAMSDFGRTVAHFRRSRRCVSPNSSGTQSGAGTDATRSRNERKPGHSY